MKYVVVSIMMSILVAPALAFAQLPGGISPTLPPGWFPQPGTPPPPTTIPQAGPATFQSLGGFQGWLQGILSIAFTIIGIFSVMVILYAAGLFMFGGGSDEVRKKAKSYLIYGSIGVAVAIMAGSIVVIVWNVLVGQ